MSAIEALEHHGIEGYEQGVDESDFDFVKRALSEAKVGFVVREENSSVGEVKFIILSRLTIDAIAAKITLDSSLEALLRVQPFIEFIDGNLASF